MKRTGSIVSRVPPAVTRTLHAGQVVGQGVAAVQQQLGERGDLLGLGQPACAAVGAGEPSGRRLQDDRTAAAQRGHVVDGGRVKPHLGVHRGREEHRTSRGEQRGGQQVVGTTRDGPRQQVGGGRGDHDEVGLLPDPDVWHLVHVIPDAGVDRVAGQRLERRGADEAQRGLGRNDTDGMARLGQLTHDRGRLVGGDATGDADDDPLAFGHFSSSPKRLIAAPSPLLAFGVFEQVFVDLAHRDRQRLLLQAGLDQRADIFEDAVAELVVVVVDLARALGGVDDQRVLAGRAVEQLVDGRIGDAQRGVIGAGAGLDVVDSGQLGVGGGCSRRRSPGGFA